MELITYLALGGIIGTILIVEYIYRFSYIHNMRRLAANDYQDL